MKKLEALYCSALSTHRATVLLIIVVFTALSLWGVWGLSVDADFMTLLDPSNKTVAAYRNVLSNFTGTDSFSLFIEGLADDQRLAQFLEQLKNQKEITEVRIVPLDSASSPVKEEQPKAVLVLVKPVFKPTDFTQSRRLSKAIKSLAEQSGVPVGITGSYQVLIESADAANRDMSRAGAATLIGILILLLVVFRIPWLVVLCMGIALCVGLCWTLGLVRLTMGQLNLLTATLPAVMLGLGVDFSLHMIYAFNEKTALLGDGQSGPKHKPDRSFLTYTFSKIYRPLLIAGLTTSAAFLSLCFAKSRGLYEMGLMGAMGIGCAFIAATGLLAILLSMVPVATLARIRRIDGIRFSGLQLLGSKGRLFTIMFLVLAAGAVGAAQVRFSSDQNKLADESLPAYELQNKLQDQQGLSLVPIAFVCPDTQTEQAKLAFLTTLPDSPFGLMESYLLAQQEGENPNRFLGADNSHLILAYPKSNAFDPVVFERIESVARASRDQFPAPGNLVTGSPFLNAALNRIIQIDLFRCSLLAGVFVCGLVFYYFRNVTYTVIAMLPVAMGTLLMVGFMGYADIDFTIMTIVIVPLVIGAGIDDGVHLLSRWRIENRNMTETLRSVASPIIGTTLTSMIGFGSLLLSHNPGFRQIGLVVLAGLGFCLLVSFVFLPPMLNFIRGDKSQ